MFRVSSLLAIAVASLFLWFGTSDAHAQCYGPSIHYGHHGGQYHSSYNSFYRSGVNVNFGRPMYQPQFHGHPSHFYGHPSHFHGRPNYGYGYGMPSYGGRGISIRF